MTDFGREVAIYESGMLSMPDCADLFNIIAIHEYTIQILHRLFDQMGIMTLNGQNIYGTAWHPSKSAGLESARLMTGTLATRSHTDEILLHDGVTSLVG